MPLKVPNTVPRSADDLDQEHLSWPIRTPPSTHPIPPHQGVREGIKIENTWKEEEKRGKNKEKGRERIREQERRLERGMGEKIQEIRIERDKRERKENKEKE